MRIAMLSFSQNGWLLGEQLASRLDGCLHTRCSEGGLHEWTAAHFYDSDALIFVGAASIAVRAISSHLRSKTSDPAVLCLDERGQFVIPLLSGHIGGANKLAAEIAALVGAISVITTATDVNGVFAVDSWAVAQCLFIHNPEKIKEISAKLLKKQRVFLKSDYPITGNLPENISFSDREYDIVVTERHSSTEALRLIPPILTLGVGCKKNTPLWALQELFVDSLEKAGVHQQAIKRVATIDLKKEEPALLKFCDINRFEFITFSSQQLNGAKGTFSSSDFVKRIAGVDCVCEQSAVVASQGKLILQKNSKNGVTMALAKSDYTLSF